ncbi:MAG TPA: tripartite tricarboxylate transporter permease [Rhodocyclaceae bacterium]|nr:tripartite tricarboxylate transporter permease [Rhodocyclaceae bacterium]
METLINISNGMLTALDPLNLGVLLIGLSVGVIAGAMPGISFVNAMAIALPFTYMMSPLASMVFLGGIYAGGVFGGSISAILINIPGTPASLPSCWDGYPMTQRGESARALTIAIVSSAFGGIASALLLTFAAPPFAQFALTFGQPEFFAATFLGLVSIVAIAKAAPWTSFVSLLLGIVIGSIGVDPLYGLPRLTFGIPALQSGIDFVVVMIGLFAFCEVLEMLGKPRHDHGKGVPRAFRIPSLRDFWAVKGAAGRGAAIGCSVGMVPGAGATVGAVIAYGIEKQVSPRGDDFGTGVEAGLAAPEAASNATTGAAMIPLLTLGIPGSAATAIMLAALVLHGVNPGPLLFATQTNMVYAIFASLLLANLFMIVAGVLVARGFSSILRIPPTILGGFIIVMSVVGAYGVRNNIFDVYVCLFFGVVGYIMKRANFPSAPLVLGVILGPLAERYFMTSLANYDNDPTIFFTRPISATILTFSVAFVAWALIPEVLKKLRRLKRETDRLT